MGYWGGGLEWNGVSMELWDCTISTDFCFFFSYQDHHHYYTMGFVMITLFHVDLNKDFVAECVCVSIVASYYLHAIRPTSIDLTGHPPGFVLPRFTADVGWAEVLISAAGKG